MSQPSLSKIQAVFGLSWLSNINFGLDAQVGTPGSTDVTTLYGHALNGIQEGIAAMPQGASEYTPTLNWGPMLLTSPSNDPKAATGESTTDNLMYVVSGNSPWDENTFLIVVALAGTNATSYTGWFSEDFDVSPTQWPYNSAAIGTMVYNGGFVAEEALVALNDPTRTVADFLANLGVLATPHAIAGKTVEVAVTGHSLGGGLAPLVALRLQDALPKYIQNFVDVKVTCWPSAGPTPGNSDFVTLLDKQFPGDNYQSTINSHDIVPKGWVTDNLNSIPALYNKAGFKACTVNAMPVNCIVAGMVAWAESLAANLTFAGTTNVKYPFDGPAMNFDVDVETGLTLCEALSTTADAMYAALFDNSIQPYNDIATYIREIWSVMTGLSPDLFSAVNIHDFLDFLTEVGYQHTTAYVNFHLGGTTWGDELVAISKNAADDAASFDKLYNLTKALAEASDYVTGNASRLNGTCS